MDQEAARAMLKWIVVGVGINATALLMIMVGILVLGRHLNKGLQAISATTERIAFMTERILREIRER